MEKKLVRTSAPASWMGRSVASPHMERYTKRVPGRNASTQLVCQTTDRRSCGAQGPYFPWCRTATGSDGHGLGHRGFPGASSGRCNRKIGLLSARKAHEQTGRHALPGRTCQQKRGVQVLPALKVSILGLTAPSGIMR